MKTMKIRYIYLLIVFMFIAMSCDESFLEVSPTDKLTSETYFETEDDFVAAANGVYGAQFLWRQQMEFFPMIDMATPAAVHGGGRYKYWHQGNSGATPEDLIRSHVLSVYWRQWWFGIGRANELLYRISVVDDGVFKSEELKNRIKGEALFLRAFFYFNLTYIWGDLPLQTEPTGGDNYFPTKVSHSKIAEQMIKDLKEASELLPSVKEYRNTDNVGRANSGAALALLGKVYCFEERWSEAETALNKLIKTGDYALTPGPTGFNDQFWSEGENGIESIFEFQYTAGTGDALGNAFASYCSVASIDGLGFGYGYIQPTDWMLDKFETVKGYTVTSTFDSVKADGSFAFSYSSADPDFDPDSAFKNRDPRLKWTIMYEGSPYVKEKFPDKTFAATDPDESNFATVKYVVHQKSSMQSEMNLVVLRYADVLLLYAEALMEQNKLGDAVKYVNMIRTRESVKMPVVTSSVASNQESLREFIHNERIRELAFEYGHIFYDLRRWSDSGGKNLWLKEMQNYWTANKLGWNNAAAQFDSHNILFPIPQNEIELNPNLKQNEGY